VDDTDARTLAEQYTALLAAVSQCARAARDGDWHYLSDQADATAKAAQHLSRVAASVSSHAPAADTVLSIVSAASGLEAVRLLHPPPRGAGKTGESRVSMSRSAIAASQQNGRGPAN